MVYLLQPFCEAGVAILPDESELISCVLNLLNHFLVNIVNEHINSVLLISFADQGHQFVQLVSKEDLFPLLSDVVVRAIELVLGRLQVLVELLLFLSITAKQLLFARINVLLL